MHGFPSWIAGLALASAVSLAAWRWRALAPSGALAATVAGTVAVGAGWSWGIILIAYFASSSLLSRLRAAERERRVSGRVDKGGARDAIQVLANGGIFVLAATAYWNRPDALWQAAGAGALAASAADTWATEIGTLARATPRSIVTGAAVPAGTSGGVTIQGFLASIAGAAFVAAIAWAFDWPVSSVAAALAGGVAGSVADSLLGATVQSRRWCAVCGMATEQRVHRCGTATTVVGGWRWLDNDGVNALATASGALVGVASEAWLRG